MLGEAKDYRGNGRGLCVTCGRTETVFALKVCVPWIHVQRLMRNQRCGLRLSRYRTMTIQQKWWRKTKLLIIGFRLRWSGLKVTLEWYGKREKRGKCSFDGS